MFRRLWALAAAIVLLGAVPTGTLYVTTLPTGADVWLDGTYVGHSPLVLDALTVGRHTVSLNRTGWVSLDLDVSVVAGATALSSVALTPAGLRGVRGSGGSLGLKGLAVKSLQVDGSGVSADPNGTYPLASGTHQLVALTSAGKVTRNFTVYPDMRTDVILRADDSGTRSAVVAPAGDYLPAGAIKIVGAHVAIRFKGHVADGTVGEMTYRLDGRSVTYDAAPTVIGTQLYLPLELLKAIAGADLGAQ